jgi:hypothetical protein
MYVIMHQQKSLCHYERHFEHGMHVRTQAVCGYEVFLGEIYRLLVNNG